MRAPRNYSQIMNMPYCGKNTLQDGEDPYKAFAEEYKKREALAKQKRYVFQFRLGAGIVLTSWCLKEHEIDKFLDGLPRRAKIVCKIVVTLKT